MSGLPIALQMYTVRDDAAQNFIGTLKKVAAVGYKAIELAGMHNLSASELKKVLDDLDIKVIASHVPRAALENEIMRVFEETHVLGNKYIVLPWLPEVQRQTAEDWLRLADSLNEIGAKCQAEGFQLCYHNHDFEFAKFDGQVAYDLLFNRVDPKYVSAEIDVYWVQYAGGDPAALIRRFAGRIPLVHIKDMTQTMPHTFAEIGEGTIDFKPIFEAGQASHTEWYIVEQDKCGRPPLESIAISWRNLQTMTA